MKAKRVLPLVVLGFLLCTLLQFPFPTEAEESIRAIQFADAADLALTWPENIEFAVLNNTTQDITVTVGIHGLKSTSGNKAVEGEELLQPYKPTIAIAASGSKPVVLAIDANKKLDPDTYTGMLVVSEQSNNVVIRKSIQMTVPDPKSLAETSPTPLTPGVDKLTITAFRWLPYVNPVCLSDCSIPVKHGSEAIQFKAGHLAYLNGDNGGVVSLSQESFSTDKGVQLGFQVEDGWGRVGKFEGEVDFLPEDKEAGNVTLTVNVKDIILWPILVLLLGIYGAVWTEHWVGIRRALWALLRRQGTVQATFDKQNDPIFGYSIKADVNNRLSELLARIKALDKTAFQTFTKKLKTALQSTQTTTETPAGEKDAHQEAVAELELIEEGVAAWKGFDQQLNALKAALDTQAKPAIDKADRPPKEAFPDPPPDQPHLYASPRFYTAARLLLEGEPLTLGQFKAICDKITAAEALAKQWGDWENIAAWTRAKISELRKQYDQLLPTEQTLLDAAQQNVDSAWMDLWLAADAGELATKQTEAELVSAQDAVWRLLRHFPVPPLPKGAAESVAGSRGQDIRIDNLGPLPVTHLPAEPNKRVQYAQQALFLGDGALVKIALAIALITGLTQLYFSANFGTLANYLTALTWGAGTQATLTVLNTALERLFGQRSGA